MAQILIVDDEKNIRRSLSIAVEEWGHSATEASSAEEAINLITKDVYDIIITDLVMDEMDGVDLLRKTKEISPSTELLIMSAHGTIAKAVEAMRIGAYDFVVKPFSMDHLELVLQKLTKQMGLKRTVKHLKAVLAECYPADDIVATSPAMADVMQQVALLANASAPVLIQGESGVGKELIAMAVHHLSPREGMPFVPVNCGAFSETLLDSELFGHCKGAFTGAVQTKRGLIEEANSGTLLLDEIGEAPQALQVRLLRFLDNGRFRRIGEVEERESDVRIIAATNRDLTKDIESEKFREDLYYRLSVAVIDIPPLRARREDITVLSQRFLELFAKRIDKPVKRLHPKVYDRFMQYAWPGNIRELENTIEHAVIVSRTDEIKLGDLPLKFRQSNYNKNAFHIEDNLPLGEVERRYILSTLQRTEGNKKKAAEILNISRTTLISRLKTYHLNDSE